MKKNFFYDFRAYMKLRNLRDSINVFGVIYVSIFSRFLESIDKQEGNAKIGRVISC